MVARRYPRSHAEGNDWGDALPLRQPVDPGRLLVGKPLRRIRPPEALAEIGMGVENPARFGEAIYARSGSRLYVNLFVASTATTTVTNEPVEITQTTHIKRPLPNRMPASISPRSRDRNFR